MRFDAWHLPWGEHTVPHALLDIIRGCNISCNACYNSRPLASKTLAQIEAELDLFQSERRLSCVSIAGGEPLLHPDLLEIVRLVKQRRLDLQLFSNGVLLDDRSLSKLKKVGVDIIYVHIERGQNRPDLPSNASAEQLRDLWRHKAEQIASHGIDVGMTMTAYPDRLAEAREMISFMLDSKHVNYLLITLFRDTQRLANLQGNLRDGISGAIDSSAARTDTLKNADMIDYLQKQLNLRPFAYLGSNRSLDDPRWLSYMVVTARNRSGGIRRYSMKASAFEKVICELLLRSKGAYPIYRAQRTFDLMAQLLGNALLGGDFFGNFKFLMRACVPGTQALAKRLLFQCPADIEADGTLTHCRNCPDAVIKDGELVPVCISDRIIATEAGIDECHT